MHNIVYHIIGNKSNILLVYRHVFAVFGNINFWNRLVDLTEPIYQRIDTAKPQQYHNYIYHSKNYYLHFSSLLDNHK